MTAQAGLTFEDARADRSHWGRLVESAVGAHLANAAMAGVGELYYWRERSREVDFVMKAGRFLTAIEVKSGATREAQPGMAEFAKAFRPQRTLLVGSGGISISEFLMSPVEHWVT